MAASEGSAPPSGIPAGSVLGGCRIEHRIGQGGMGTVYLARQLQLDRLVALKVVNPVLAGDVGFTKRFRSETRIAAQVEHPNVVPLYEAGEEGGVLYMLMRYIPGRDLGALLVAEGPPEPARAVELIAQTAAGLDAVHAAGLVHRDLKPANVLVSEGGGREHVYLTDFGLAKRAASSSGPTKAGHFVGTLDYLAPEQLTGEPVDARADVYALGCLLFELLTGSVPYPRDDSAATMWAHVNSVPPLLSDSGPELERFDELVARAMAKRPSERFPSAGALGRAALALNAGLPSGEPEESVATGRAAPAAIGGAPPPTRMGAGGAEAAPTTVVPPPSDVPPAATTPPTSAPTRRSGSRGGRGRRLAPVASSLIAATLALAAVATLAFAGVLGGGEPGGPTPTPAPRPSGPNGDLTPTGIGEVQIGDTGKDVEAAFGKPDDKGPTGAIEDPTSKVVWIYEIDDGEPSEDSVRLYFNFRSADKTLVLSGYSSVTDQLGTAEGVTSGSTVRELRSAYGGRLEKGPPQVQTPATYIVRGPSPGGYPALIFGIQSGQVGAIEGGNPPPTLGFSE